MSGEMRLYYSNRSTEYENVCSKPERQLDLENLTHWLQKEFDGLDVLEIAYGTGYWTQKIASTANSILATDMNEEMLEVARAKDYPIDKVQILRADAFDLASVPGNFTGVFAGFLWSHIPLSQIERFLRNLHKRVGQRKLVVFVDNNYVEGSNHPLVRRDAEGNTFQVRRLSNGETYEVLKNFPSEQQICGYLEPNSESIRFHNLKYYWGVSYRSTIL